MIAVERIRSGRGSLRVLETSLEKILVLKEPKQRTEVENHHPLEEETGQDQDRRPQAEDEGIGNTRDPAQREIFHQIEKGVRQNERGIHLAGPGGHQGLMKSQRNLLLHWKEM